MDRMTDSIAGMTQAQLETLGDAVTAAQQQCAVCGGPHAVRYALRATGTGKRTMGHLFVCGGCLDKHRVGFKNPIVR